MPVLLRRFRDEAQAWRVNIGRPIRRSPGQLVQQAHLEQAVNLALRQPSCDAILIMFDGDTDCPAELGPRVHRWATVAAGDVPCEVVLPHREYEAWFLAAIESLRGARGVRADATPHPDPEAPRGAKEQLETRMDSRQELPGDNTSVSVQRAVLHGCRPCSMPILPQTDEIFRRLVVRNGTGCRPLATSLRERELLRWASGTQSSLSSVSPTRPLHFARVAAKSCSMWTPCGRHRRNVAAGSFRLITDS